MTKENTFLYNFVKLVAIKLCKRWKLKEIIKMNESFMWTRISAIIS